MGEFQFLAPDDPRFVGIGESAEYVPNSQQQGTQNPFATARRPSEARAQQNSGATGDSLRDSLPSDSGQPVPDWQQNQQQYPPVWGRVRLSQPATRGS